MQSSVISQAYLDDVSAVVMSNDWEAYIDSISWPFTLITHTKTLTFGAPEDIRRVFEDFVLLLRTQRVTDYIRIVETSQHIDQTLISARYVTHLMSGGQRVLDPVRSSISLRLEGNRWRAASIVNDVSTSNSRWPLLMPKLGEELP